MKKSDDKIMLTLEIKNPDSNSTNEFFDIHIYIHKISFSEHTRKTCTSIILKIFDIENSKIKPVWTKSKAVAVEEEEIQVRECLKLNSDSFENLTLEILENSSWIAGKTSLFMAGLGSIAAENGKNNQRSPFL